MKHLTDDEIFDFVTLDEINEDNMRLIHKVNTHMFKCDICREKVSKLQYAMDKLEQQSLRTKSKDSIKEKLKVTVNQ